MMLRSRCLPLVASTLTLVALAWWMEPVSAGSEQDLKELWDRHMGASVEDADAIIDACHRFAETHAADPLLPVVHGIESWHLFRGGKNEAAAKLLRPYLSAKKGAIPVGAAAVSRGWLTRLDRERVAQSLQVYYRKEVGYPATLKEIAEHPKIAEPDHPLLVDRFGNPWQYQLAGLKNLPQLHNQRYQLLSSTLGDQSDLAVALEAAYASGIAISPARVSPSVKSPQVIFKNPDGSESAAIPLGGQLAGVHLAYVGEAIVIVCNHSYWKIFPRP